MTSKQFHDCRSRLGKTQCETAELLGISSKAVQSYEQGWRGIPGYVERQLLFLVHRKEAVSNPGADCWELTDCPEERRNSCPAWEFDAGRICWFISGTHCRGEAQPNWEAKMKVCRECLMFNSIIDNGSSPTSFGSLT